MVRSRIVWPVALCLLLLFSASSLGIIEGVARFPMSQPEYDVNRVVISLQWKWPGENDVEDLEGGRERLEQVALEVFEDADVEYDGLRGFPRLGLVIAEVENSLEAALKLKKVDGVRWAEPATIWRRMDEVEKDP